jgi:hypothetical protein
MTGNFTVISNEEAAQFRRLQKFYQEVCDLVKNNDIMVMGDDPKDNEPVPKYDTPLGRMLARAFPENWSRTND